MSERESKKALMKASKDFLALFDTIDTKQGPVTGLPTVPEASIGWENILFEPAEKDPWVSVFYRPNTPQTRTVGPGGFDELTGFVQIDFNIAPNNGSNVLSDWENKGRIFFHPGRFFSYNGQSVIITACGMSTGRHVENFYRKSLTVAFRSHIKRNEVL